MFEPKAIVDKLEEEAWFTDAGVPDYDEFEDVRAYLLRFLHCCGGMIGGFGLIYYIEWISASWYRILYGIRILKE